MTAKDLSPSSGASRRFARAVAYADAVRRSSTETRVTTTFTYGNGYATGTPLLVSHARASSHRSDSADRWVVERTVAWMNGFRRLHRRYERLADHFLGFVGIAAALICYRRITN
ncbi:transposase [Streptomyces zaomyceticus]|uniref:transposase n=1 Tax=Streptomyces zaomyceticus TaxID=68286 RepID=UPI00371F770C